MRLLVVAILIAVPPAVRAEGFDRAQLSGSWAQSVNTTLACASDNHHIRYELSPDGKTLTFKFDRMWKLNTGRTVDQYSATVVRSTATSLVITYNPDAGEVSAGYPKEWEMAFVAPGVFRWRATDKPEGRVNTVVGIRCSP